MNPVGFLPYYKVILERSIIEPPAGNMNLFLGLVMIFKFLEK